MFVSNAAGLFALLVTLKGERTSWARRVFFGKSRKTWPVFLCLYLAPMLALIPVLRTGMGFLWLFVPLVLSTGYCIIVFGPIQDYLVARAQRRERTRLSSSQ